MFNEIIHGLLPLFDPSNIPLILGGVIFGLIIGILPGVGGSTVLVLLMPVIYGMDPLKAIILIMSAYSVTYPGGALTAILVNIPGDAGNAATLLDGFPMTQQGKAGRAIGIAQMSSLLGGIFGALVLALCIPFIRSVVMLFGSAESFMLCLMGLFFIAVLGARSPVKGLIAGGVGLIFSLIGFQSTTGVARFAFDNTYLFDGIKIIPLAMALFAVPAIISLMASGSSIARTANVKPSIRDALGGMKFVLQHWWLLLRCSFIGTLVGIIPGIGGEVAIWTAYAHAQQTSKHPERFGKGNEEGVLAPECANHAKIGGALVPTLSFGIPGSAGMAVLLGVLMVIGVQPGPTFLKEHLDLTFTIVGCMILAAAVALVICISTSSTIAKIAFVPGHILAPIILILVAIGSYTLANNLLDVVSTFILGIMGYAMIKWDYSRPSLFLGYVLGSLAERYFYISYLAYKGWQFILQPAAFTILIIIIISIAYKPVKNFIKNLKRGSR